jgi:hypothetical protein
MNTEGTFYKDPSILYILNFEAIGLPFNDNTWDDSRISAQECALWYCIQSYNISMTNNVQNQTTVRTWNTINPLLPNEWDTTTPQPGAANETAFELGNGYNITFVNAPSHMNVNPKSLYSINVRSYNATREALTAIFQGTVQVNYKGGTEYSTDYIQAIWNQWDDMNHLLSNVALSMTNNIRRTSPALPDSMYAGTAYRDILLVNVRWQWITLPSALVLLSVVFMFSIIIESRRNGVFPWKDSTLAFLVLGMDGTLNKAAQEGMDKPDGILKAVGKSRVVLSEDNGLWGFKQLTPAL